jgi:hypothetical protein
MNNSPRGIAGRLRRKIDHDDGFTSGHQIITIRRTEREDPEWAKSDVEIRKILLRSFPKLETNPKQRARAGRWTRIIQLYFRKHYTHGQIAIELELGYEHIHTLIRAIRRAGKGLKSNGKGVVGQRRVGRPKSVPQAEPILGEEDSSER